MGDTPDYSRQDPPREDPDAVSSHDLVIADLQGWEAQDVTAMTESLLASRKRYGYDKYGVVLHKDNFRDHLLDAEDEACDLTVYLRTVLDDQPELATLISPLYRDALWALVTLHSLRTGEPTPPYEMKVQYPTVDIKTVAAENLDLTLDDGHACFQPVGATFPEGWLMCGGLQRDTKMCVRAMSPHPEAYGWCPRHGVRLEPNELPADPAEPFPDVSPERRAELLEAREYYDTHDSFTGELLEAPQAEELPQGIELPQGEERP